MLKLLVLTWCWRFVGPCLCLEGVKKYTCLGVLSLTWERYQYSIWNHKRLFSQFSFSSKCALVEQVEQAKDRTENRMFVVVVEFPEKRETHNVSTKSNRNQTLSISLSHTHTRTTLPINSIFSPWAVSFNLISKLRQKVCPLRKKDNTILSCEHAERYWLAPRHASAGDFKRAQSGTYATKMESRRKSHRFLLRLPYIPHTTLPPLIHPSAHLSLYPLFPHPPPSPSLPPRTLFFSSTSNVWCLASGQAWRLVGAARRPHPVGTAPVEQASLVWLLSSNNCTGWTLYRRHGL